MSDNGAEDEDEPVVELGDGAPVEGAPIARVASRLFFPIERSEVLRQEADATIRTPDGPRELEAVLEDSDEVYFEKSNDLVEAVEAVVGTGPVPTDGDAGTAAGSTDGGTDSEGEFEFDET